MSIEASISIVHGGRERLLSEAIADTEWFRDAHADAGPGGVLRIVEGGVTLEVRDASPGFEETLAELIPALGLALAGSATARGAGITFKHAGGDLVLTDAGGTTITAPEQAMARAIASAVNGFFAACCAIYRTDFNRMVELRDALRALARTHGWALDGQPIVQAPRGHSITEMTLFAFETPCRCGSNCQLVSQSVVREGDRHLMVLEVQCQLGHAQTRLADISARMGVAEPAGELLSDVSDASELLDSVQLGLLAAECLQAARAEPDPAEKRSHLERARAVHGEAMKHMHGDSLDEKSMYLHASVENFKVMPQIFTRAAMSATAKKIEAGIAELDKPKSEPANADKETLH